LSRALPVSPARSAARRVRSRKVCRLARVRPRPPRRRDAASRKSVHLARRPPPSRKNGAIRLAASPLCGAAPWLRQRCADPAECGFRSNSMAAVRARVQPVNRRCVRVPFGNVRNPPRLCENAAPDFGKRKSFYVRVPHWAKLGFRLGKIEVSAQVASDREN
jgi:hypothetical protein